MIHVYRKFSQIVTMESAHHKDGRLLKSADLSIIDNASVAFDENKILWVGKDSDLPGPYDAKEGHCRHHFFEDKILLPEIVDAHTHAIFAGDRSFEYALRLNGASYEELAKAGGGILYTVEQTRQMSDDKLFDIAKNRIETIHSYGVGTIEIKSGYALDYQRERALSLIIDRLKKYFQPRVNIINTFMAAHAVPKDFASSAAYLDQVVLPLLEELAPLKIIDAVDIFHEVGYFTTEDVQRLFTKAQTLNLGFKSHADEFNNVHGAKLAASSGALSVEHLLSIDDDGIEALAHSSTVAMLLPGTGLFLGKPAAPARKLLDAGVKVAIASDFNPGSCHCDNVIMAASMIAANPAYRLNQAELWCALTLNAAHALNLRRQGAIICGLAPRFSLFNTTNLNQISYHWGKNFAISLP